MDDYSCAGILCYSNSVIVDVSCFSTSPNKRKKTTANASSPKRKNHNIRGSVAKLDASELLMEHGEGHDDDNILETSGGLFKSSALSGTRLYMDAR